MERNLDNGQGYAQNGMQLGEEQERDFTPRVSDITPFDRLQFAKWVLKGVFIFFIISIGVRIYNQYCGETLLEICRTGLLPIASFVIGDYFGSRGAR